MGRNHSDDDDESVDVCHHQCLGASSNFSVSQEDFTLDLESNLDKEEVLIKNSSSSHYPLCSTIFDAYTCDRDTPCSSSYSSNELNYELTQDGEIIHDENDNDKITEYSFHTSSYLLFH